MDSEIMKSPEGEQVKQLERGKTMENTNAKLMEILAEARHNYRKSMDYFEQFEAEEQEDMKRIYWVRSEEFDGKCEGLLTAYEIITGRCVLSHLIGEEIKYLKAKMDKLA